VSFSLCKFRARSGIPLFFLFRHREVFLQGRDHRGRLRLGRFDVQGETRLFHSPGSIAAKGADLGTVLLEFGVVVKKASDAAGSKEADDVVFALIEDLPDVIADRPVHERGSKSAIVQFEPVDDLVVLLVLRTGVKELLVLLMLVDDIEHALVQPVRTIEHLALAVEDELLKI